MVANLEIKLDEKSKFPLILIPKLGWVQWLPVTKIQIEYFLSSYQDSAYDAVWYYDIIRTNPRISPNAISAENYFNAIATNVLPEDCRRFASWMGQGFRLMQTNEWIEMYKFAIHCDVDSKIMDQVTAGTSKRINTLLTKIEQASTEYYQSTKSEPRKLAQQMLLTQGVVEYVYSDSSGNRFGGHGVPHKKLISSMAKPDTIQPIANSAREMRMKHFGFRLIQKV